LLFRAAACQIRAQEQPPAVLQAAGSARSSSENSVSRCYCICVQSGHLQWAGMNCSDESLSNFPELTAAHRTESFLRHRNIHVIGHAVFVLLGSEDAGREWQEISRAFAAPVSTISVRGCRSRLAPAEMFPLPRNRSCWDHRWRQEGPATPFWQTRPRAFWSSGIPFRIENERRPGDRPRKAAERPVTRDSNREWSGRQIKRKAANLASKHAAEPVTAGAGTAQGPSTGTATGGRWIPVRISVVRACKSPDAQSR